MFQPFCYLINDPKGWGDPSVVVSNEMKRTKESTRHYSLMPYNTCIDSEDSLMIVYHGNSGKKIDRMDGYVPSKKKDRSLFGVGLYTSCDYRQAQNYGRNIWQLELYLAESNNTANVRISTEKFISDAYWICSSKAAHKRLKEIVSKHERDTISLNDCQSYFVIADPKIHLIAAAVNTFLVLNGGKYSLERANGYRMILVHDFSIIKSIEKASTYDCNEVVYNE